MNRLLAVTVLSSFSGSEGDPVEEGGRDGQKIIAQVKAECEAKGADIERRGYTKHY